MIKSLKHLDDGKYHVILMNSIQYQCSFGIAPNSFRDRVWLKLWIEYKAYNSFECRLSQYNPDIIFNFCTKVGHSQDPEVLKNSRCISVINNKYLENICKLNIKDVKRLYSDKNRRYTLQGFVRCSINKWYIRKKTYQLCGRYCDYRKVIVIEGRHPCSWGHKNNRHYEKWNKYCLKSL